MRQVKYFMRIIFIKMFSAVKVRISDLSSVDINWRMLTLARPETKIEEEIFSK